MVVLTVLTLACVRGWGIDRTPFNYTLCIDIRFSDSACKRLKGVAPRILLHYVYFMGRKKITETEEQVHERKRLAVLIRILRATLGVSQRDLSIMTSLSFSSIAKLEYGDIRLNPEKLSELLSIFKAAGVEFSSEADAVTVRVGPNVLEVLYEQHGLAWPIDPKLSYAVYQKILKAGNPPDDWDRLQAIAKRNWK